MKATSSSACTSLILLLHVHAYVHQGLYSAFDIGPSTRAIISDVTTPLNRSKSLALVGLAFSVCFTFGQCETGPVTLTWALYVLRPADLSCFLLIQAHRSEPTSPPSPSRRPLSSSTPPPSSTSTPSLPSSRSSSFSSRRVLSGGSCPRPRAGRSSPLPRPQRQAGPWRRRRLSS